MIYGRCFTCLDIGKHQDWPDVFTAIPQKGDYVETVDGNMRLKVVSICHSVQTHGRGEFREFKPFIIVELNK